MTRVLLLLAVLAPPALAQQPAGAIQQRNERYAAEIEQYFRDFLVDQYPERAGRAWNRSYTSIDAFLRSVAPNRERYRRIFAPPALRPTGALERKPHPSLAAMRAEWVSVPLGGLRAEGLLVFPEKVSRPAPLVVAQHGIGSFPERVSASTTPRTSTTTMAASW